MRRFLFGAAGLLFALVAPFSVLTVGCKASSPVPPRHPTILIAVDGLEWDVMLPLIHEGKLPVITQLMKKGVFGRLRTFRPTSSPVIWTSIATGKTRQEHGIKGFAYRDRRSGARRLYTSGHRKTKAFWNILSDYDLIVHCVGWWTTFPVEEISGIMVAQTNTPDQINVKERRAIRKGSVLNGVDGQVWPPSLEEEVMSIVEGVEVELPSLNQEIFGSFEHPLSELDRMLWENTQWSFRADAINSRIARRILSSGEPYDVLAVYLGGADVSGHRFWRYMRPSEFSTPPTEEQVENFEEIIQDYYGWIDMTIGQLLETQAEDVTIFVISDHGMHAINRDQSFDPDVLDPDALADSVSAHHRDAPSGVFIASGFGIVTSSPQDSGALPDSTQALRTVGSVFDVAPTLLTQKGIPVGADMKGKVLHAVLDADFLRAYPEAEIQTHDTPEWVEGREIRSRDASAEEERLEQLRSLGYVP